MKKLRWLLPFTHGVDHRAIETVVCQAQEKGAILVAVPLIFAPHGRQTDTRLEHIQQAKDFLVLAQRIAGRHHVPVEEHEVFTGDVEKSIVQLADDLHCDTLVLVMSERQGVLLSTQEIKNILLAPPQSLVLIRLPESRKTARSSWAAMWLFSWKRQPHELQESFEEEKVQLNI